MSKQIHPKYIFLTESFKRTAAITTKNLFVVPVYQDLKKFPKSMNPLFLLAVSLRQSIYVNICQRTVCPIDVIVLILSIYGYITYKENPEKLQASSNATPLQF